MCGCNCSCNPTATPHPQGGGGCNCTKCRANWCCSPARLSDCFGSSQSDVCRYILLVGRYHILLTAAAAAPCKVAVGPHTPAFQGVTYSPTSLLFSNCRHKQEAGAEARCISRCPEAFVALETVASICMATASCGKAAASSGSSAGQHPTACAPVQLSKQPSPYLATSCHAAALPCCPRAVVIVLCWCCCCTRSSWQREAKQT